MPDRDTLSGLSAALSVTCTFAARAPVAVGRKVTLTVQLAPTAKLAGQLFVCEKSPALAPVIATPLIDSAAVPEFVRETECAALEFPTC